MSDQVILDAGNDVTFPPDPHNLPKSAESSAVPLPDTWTEEVIVGMGLGFSMLWSRAVHFKPFSRWTNRSPRAPKSNLLSFAWLRTWILTTMSKSLWIHLTLKPLKLMTNWKAFSQRFAVARHRCSFQTRFFQVFFGVQSGRTIPDRCSLCGVMTTSCGCKWWQTEHAMERTSWNLKKAWVKQSLRTCKRL